jgi:hypothetical protein
MNLWIYDTATLRMMVTDAQKMANSDVISASTRATAILALVDLKAEYARRWDK